jgi:hypothetical protein
VESHDWLDPSFVLNRSDLDISITYDGYIIVSGQFRQVAGEAGVEYRALSAAPGFYDFRVSNAVAFDTARRETKFVDPCPQCKRFRSIVGATPVFLRELVDGSVPFYRTDLEFGNGDAKHPILLVTDWMAIRLERASIRGLELVPIG